ncbi:cytochrome c oxidase subunit IV-domain-containing protein, partial [Dipodascopsis tothii]|uniref:cytochrome c oxidase subunit IV-domain-containing protein n=1 Tax=Dipodascopsis tothii TaxID=44089 RepID=UPI0034CEA0F6
MRHRPPLRRFSGRDLKNFAFLSQHISFFQPNRLQKDCTFDAMLRTSILRSTRAAAPAVARPMAARHAHAVSTPVLADLESRWEGLPVTEQVDITKQLWDRQKGPWTELTPAEKRASFYISYGEWGPRKPVFRAGDGLKIFGGVVTGIAVSVVLFAITQQFAQPVPETMTKEWQQAGNEYYKEKNLEPLHGDWSLVQSPSKHAK